MFSLSFKLSTAVPALLSAFSKTKTKTKALTTSADSTSSTTLDPFASAHIKRTPTRSRVTVHEVMVRFAKSHPETSSPIPTPTPTRDIRVPEPLHFRMPTRRTANSRATAMDVAAMFDKAHVDTPSSVRGTEVRNALSRIIANASQE